MLAHGIQPGVPGMPEFSSDNHSCCLGRTAENGAWGACAFAKSEGSTQTSWLGACSGPRQSPHIQPALLSMYMLLANRPRNTNSPLFVSNRTPVSLGISVFPTRKKLRFPSFFQIGAADEVQEVTGWGFLESPCCLFSWLCLNSDVVLEPQP